MLSAGIIFPSDFPDDCPPNDSVQPEGTFYRIVRSNPPTDDDFISVVRGNRERALGLVRKGNITLCEAMGLSVYGYREDILQHASQSPQLGMFISEIRLGPADGRILSTSRRGNSHHTWWLPTDSRPSNLVTNTRAIDEV